MIVPAMQPWAHASTREISSVHQLDILGQGWKDTSSTKVRSIDKING
jgi:hypothetical protein